MCLAQHIVNVAPSQASSIESCHTLLVLSWNIVTTMTIQYYAKTAVQYWGLSCTVGLSLLSNIVPTISNFIHRAKLEFNICPDLLWDIVPVFIQG